MIKRISEYQETGAEKEFMRTLNDRILKHSEKREEVLKEGGILDQWQLSESYNWRGFINQGPEEATDREGKVYKACSNWPGIILKYDPEARKKAIAFAYYAKESFRKLMTSGITSEDLAKMKEDESAWAEISDKYRGILKDVCGDYLKTGAGNILLDYLWVLFAHAGQQEDWFWNAIEEWGRFYHKNFAKPEANYEYIVKITSLEAMAYRIVRCARLTNLEAPAIILHNEFHILVEAVYPLLAKIIGATADFEKYTGWTMEGEWIGKASENEEEEDLPPLAEDQPEYDKDGNPIKYEWDKRSEKWVRIE